MAKNSIAVYGAEGKSNLLFFDPDKLTLVTDPTHPLYDERALRPFSEAMVLNIMALGVFQPVVITKDAETGSVLVAAGRGRIINCREANRRLRARGEEPLQVPAVVRRADSDGLAGVMVAENELRENDTPLNRARKMQRFIDRGRGHDAIAIIFGCSEATVKNTLALLDAPAVVRQAVEAGDITMAHAKALAKLPPATQREKVTELKAVGAKTTGHARAKAQREVIAPNAPPKMRSRVEVQARHDEAEVGSAERQLLAWVLGTV
ncbi:MAG TPA: hypothetical protein VGE36_13625 [Roseateles sp.]